MVILPRSPFACLLGAFLLVATAEAQPFHFPTANHALYEPNGEARFFVGTPGRTWESGQFGCVRSEGWQMHEGLDIRSIDRDRRGEPADPVLATADGIVSYVNRRPGLSNYGNYIVLRHQIDGVEIYSLYAHLREVESGLKSGSKVKAGQRIGLLGRTSNTRQRISLERAHVHFELALLLNDRFAGWYKKFHPGERNDHGNWNGQNLAGLNPKAIFLAQKHEGKSFNLLSFIRNQTTLCRVLVRDTSFPWLRRYPDLIRPNPIAQREGIAGYELALDFNGVPFQLMPRAASESPGSGRTQLVAVNEAEYQRNHCRRLVQKRGNHWELTNRGEQWLSLLTY